MSGKPVFNYIITIHNKEFLLERVLAGVAECAGSDALILPVLDGCTDGSEEVAVKFARESPVETRVLYAPDVNEIITINIALREARPGYCVIIQDDVILQEPRLEEKIDNLCVSRKNRLGYISFRLAADMSPTPLYRRLRLVRRLGLKALRPLVEEREHVGHPGETLGVPKIDYGEFVERMVGIKSPVCITPELRRVEPFLDEALAPYCYDDHDLSLRSLRQGLVNGLFGIRFETNEEWSGAKKDPTYATYGDYVRWRNRSLMWVKHGDFILHYLATRPGRRAST